MRKNIVVVGGGFTGLSAAFYLAEHHRVTVIEADDSLGGLAGTFEIDGFELEKFYHHWFTSDRSIMRFIEELGAGDRVQVHPTRTGTYYANHHYRLSTPLDLLRFDALTLPSRIRLGMLTLYARSVTDWRRLEALTAKEWLLRTAGSEVFAKVWEPLLVGKFGPHAEEVGAVWFWNKLKLRGGSRGKGGREELAYFDGGFGALIGVIRDRLLQRGVDIHTGTTAHRVTRHDGHVSGVVADGRTYPADAVLLTPALPIVGGLLHGTASPPPAPWSNVTYLANVCLVLVLDRSLSDTYWLNVNDASFPFVGIIEHTNFVPPSDYGGRHLVYLSKYLPHTEPLFGMQADELTAFAVPYLRRMFPHFRETWIQRSYAWRARYAQPVVGVNYSETIRDTHDVSNGIFVASMAQIYPEDRGTNHAVREGQRVAERIETWANAFTRPGS